MSPNAKESVLVRYLPKVRHAVASQPPTRLSTKAYRSWHLPLTPVELESYMCACFLWHDTGWASTSMCLYTAPLTF